MEGHPPITEVAVFSLGDHDPTDIWIAFVRPNNTNGRYTRCELVFIRQFQDWKEYRIKNWMRIYPTCFTNETAVISRLSLAAHDDVCSLDSDDCIGYFADTHRNGYAIHEGSDFFVNYLCPPPIWTIENHALSWPPWFQKEVWCILCCCWRLGGAFRHLRFEFIKQLSLL
jgi:hypothetical protein